MRGQPDSGGEPEDTSEDTQGKRRLDLSVPQVAGSAVAAVLAAKLASSFGVYGTILGAGVVSGIATCGGTVFQHFFKRTGEQIRDVAVQAKPKAQQVPAGVNAPVPEVFRAAPPVSSAPSMPSAPYATGAGPVTTTWGRQYADHTAPDADRTTVLPHVADADPTTVLPQAGPGASDADATQLLGAVDATRMLPPDQRTQVLRQAAPAGPGEPPLPSEEFTEGTTHRARVTSWKRPLVAAAVVFGVALTGITTYELVSGQSFSGDGKSTTISDAFKGRNSSSSHDDQPTGDSDQPSGDATPSEGDGSQQDDGTSKDPSGTPSPNGDTGSDTGKDQGGKPDDGGDKDKDDDGSKVDPTPTPTPTPKPTPTPTPSSGGGNGSDNGGQEQRQSPEQ
ncbi:hypothetical protein RB200_04605 [Streptomyces sp. PmtG]